MNRWVKRSKHNGRKRKRHGKFRREKTEKIINRVASLISDSILQITNNTSNCRIIYES